jgi:hypothetical protein
MFISIFVMLQLIKAIYLIHLSNKKKYLNKLLSLNKRKKKKIIKKIRTSKKTNKKNKKCKAIIIKGSLLNNNKK